MGRVPEIVQSDHMWCNNHLDLGPRARDTDNENQVNTEKSINPICVKLIGGTR